MIPAKTVAALHDLSGLGRCSLTVIIPVISAMGVQVVPAPTAVLSAHTAFPDFVSQDLTDFLEQTLDKWCEMGMEFDCIYSGYLATVRQEELTRRFMERQPSALRIVDPVMGDDGRMYRALPSDMPEAMRRLCRCADMITPNLTEASLLTGTPCLVCGDGQSALGTASGITRSCAVSELRDLLCRLLELGPRTALITGVPLEDRHVNAWMSSDGVLHTLAYEPVPAGYPGTGDLFTSVIAGALTRGTRLPDAVSLATTYVRDVILHTSACGTAPLYGVQLESTLGSLCQGGAAPLDPPLKGH